MTVQDILANNSRQEDIVIIVHSQEQYEDFMHLLDTQGYHWHSGKKVYGENQWIPDCFRIKEDYMLLTITLNSEENTITYSNFFNNGFDLEEFESNASFLFGTNNFDDKPFASIYKPYLVLKQELKNYAEDYKL